MTIQQCYENLLKGLYICFVLLMAACADEPIARQTTDVVEGVPTTIRLSLTMPESEKITVTRAGEIDTEAVFYDLYIMIFNSEGVLKTKRYWDFRQSPETDGVYEIDDLQTTSGVSYIYGFANIGNQGRPSEYNGEVKTQLDVAEIGEFTKNELKQLTVSLVNKNTDILHRTAATSLLAGKYVSGTGDGWNDQGDGYCIIRPGNSTVQLSGRVELHSLDARITFKLIVGDKVTKPSSGTTYEPSFTATSYQVMNLPMKSRLLNETTDWDGDDPRNVAETDYYSMKDENVTIYETIEEGEGDNAEQYQTFYFYMPENRKSPKSSITEYAQREEQEKTHINGNNVINGDWKYAPTYGTYVVISGVFRGYTKDDEGTIKPLEANVTYKIHLGNFGNSTAANGNFDNFDTNRNTNYTYTVKVNGVNNIIVEVEDDKENQPGATGEIYFTDETDLYTLDAHYETCLMHFSYSELYGRDKEFINYTVHTPFTNLGAEKSDDANWVRFAVNNKNENVYSKDLQDYRNCGNLMTVDELIELLKRMQSNEYHDNWDTNKEFYITCFVNEYYYTNDEEELEALTEGADANLADDIKKQYQTPITIENDVPAWKYAVNQPNRTLMLLTNVKTSNDGESSIIDAAYVISQRSIQTFYNTDPSLTGLTSALGIETINETGYLEMGDPQTYPTNLRDGLSNTLAMWKVTSLTPSLFWNTYIDYTTNGYSTANTSQTDISVDYIGLSNGDNYRFAYLGCLQRNRDTNRNGVIDEEEVRWYMPALNQYASFFMGAAALSQESRFYRYPDWRLKHFYSSTYRGEGENNVMTVWAEEGFSTSTAGDADEWYYNDKITTRYYRCVRNLGNITKHDGYEQGINTPQNYWRASGKNGDYYYKFYFDYLSPSAVRQNIVENSELGGTHTEQSATNRVYWGFEVSPGDAENYNGNNGTDDRTRENQAHAATTDCYNYTPNSEPEGTWRVPNQRELLFMLLNGVGGTDYINFPLKKWGSSNGSDGAYYFSRTLFTWGIVAARQNNTNYYTPLKPHPNDDNGYTGDKRRYGYYTTYNGNMSLSNQTDNNPSTNSFLNGYIRCVRDIEIE